MTETALALVDPRSVEPALAAGPAVSRLHFGSEFCETLLPAPAQLRHVQQRARDVGLAFTLVTPILSDKGIDQLKSLLDLVEPGGEVVANDWGTLALLGRERPDLKRIAGRMICKMVKDPRLPSAEWARLYPHGIHSAAFAAVLERLGVARIEMDVPPFADMGDFRSDRFKVSVHTPYGFSVKGRACRIGSLNQPAEERFATGHACGRECLNLVGTLSRSGTGERDLATFQRGTTLFYRHSEPMEAAMQAARADGWIDRIVISGDWHEAGRAV